MPDSDDPSRREGRYDRRELLRRAGVGAATLGVAGSGLGKAFYGPLRFKGRWLKGDLTIIQWAHFVPAYDKWFDNTWVKTWGQKNDVQVHVDHILNTLLPARAAAEVAAGQGHDLFFQLSPHAEYEDQVIDHKEIVQTVSHKLGKIGIVGKHATYNPKTKKWFAFADNYVPDPVIWRHDYWNGVGLSPNTWENVRKAAPQLKAHGHPIGIGQSAELDSSMALIAFLMCFGTYVQSDNARVTIKSKHTVEAVKFMADIFKRGEINDKQAFLASKFYNFPTWPKAMPFSQIRKVAGRDPHKPHGKYQVLTTIAQKYTVNPGYPGYTNAAFSEAFNKFLIPKMFAQVSQSKMSADDAVSAANHDLQAIYTKWRKLGKI